MTPTVTLANGRTFNVVGRSALARGDDRSHPSPASSKPRRNKYNAQSVVVDGITFDSKREAERWQELRILERGHKIAQLERQVPYVLASAVRLHGEKRLKPAIRIVVDFRYFDGASGTFVIEDVKGRETAVSRLKRHLMKSVHGIDVRIVK